MKPAAALACGVVLLAGVCSAAPRPTPTPAGGKEGVIAGVPVARGQGGWLGIEVQDRTFRLTFYDEKKKPVAADATSAVFRWPVHYQPNDERILLQPTDDPSVLASPYVVKGPLAFKLHITLLFEGKPDAAESYVVDFQG